MVNPKHQAKKERLVKKFQAAEAKAQDEDQEPTADGYKPWWKKITDRERS